MRVIVVDDAAAIRIALGRILVSLGHAVVGEATSLVGGLDVARELTPDAIVVDGRLLAVDLVAAVASVRAAAPNAAIVVIGARDETTLVRDALSAGATNAIRRPISRSSVAAAFGDGRASVSDGDSRMLRPGAPRNEPHG